MTLLVAFRLADGVDWIKDDTKRKNDLNFDLVFNFLLHLSNIELFSFLYRVCMYDTHANASSVYFDGFHNNASENLQHTDDAPLLCIEESTIDFSHCEGGLNVWHWQPKRWNFTLGAETASCAHHGIDAAVTEAKCAARVFACKASSKAIVSIIEPRTRRHKVTE